MRLIGIAGQAGSGKDAAAAYLVEKYGVTRYSFADPLKEGVKTMLGLTDEHVNGALKEKVVPELGVSPRRIMQTLGTEWGRDTIRHDLWVLLAEKRWRAMQGESCGGMVIADIRFEDEADFVDRNGGLVVHLVRTDAVQVEAHQSEAGIRFRSGHAGIENNGSLADLHRQLDVAIEMWDAWRKIAAEKRESCGA